MLFQETPIRDCRLARPERRADERGWFARIFCQRELAAVGLDPRLVQANLSANRLRGTLRGLHYQAAPHGEAKIVTCVRGSLWDVVVDLRPESPTYLVHHGVALDADGHDLLCIPAGCAHGFLTLADDTEILYFMSEFYVPEAARGVRWDDPALGIEWPGEVRVLSDRDRSYPDYEPEVPR